MNRTAYQTQKIFFALGTVCTLTAFGSGALRALDRAKARITEIDRLVNTCDPKADIRDVFMGSDRLIRSLRDHGVEPEISVLAKGYAADEARRILIAENITEALIEIGDTVITVGSDCRIRLPKQARSIPSSTPPTKRWSLPESMNSAPAQILPLPSQA